MNTDHSVSLSKLRHALEDSRNLSSVYSLLADHSLMERTANGFRSISPEVIQRRCRELLARLSVAKQIAEAALLGEAAFLAGRQCVPALDAGVMPLLKGVQAGESVLILQAWLDAWHKANLAAPVV